MSEGRLRYLERRVEELEQRQEIVRGEVESAVASLDARRYDRVRRLLEKLTELVREE